MSKILIAFNFFFLMVLGKDVKCGYHIYDKQLSGAIAAIDEFPWVARLGFIFKNGTNAGFKCGGALISTRHIVTSASCIKNEMLKDSYLNTVRLGEYDLSENKDCVEIMGFKDCADPHIDVNISYFRTHALFKNIDNDIAVVGFQREVKFTDFIRPICLPQSTVKLTIGQRAYVSGWNTMDDQSQLKLKMETVLENFSSCNSKFQEFGIYLKGTMHLCARESPCYEDSGAPLMSINENGQWTLYGVASGVNDCKRKGWPGLYTSVDFYTQWIRDNMF